MAFKQASSPTYNKYDLYQFFAVAFSAAPGVTYMGQLLDAANSGLSIKNIVNIFTGKTEFTATYPTSGSTIDFATRLVGNVVGTSATEPARQEAISDVVAALALPSWTRGDVIFAIFTNLANKSDTDPQWGATTHKMKNQVIYAKYFTEVMKGDTTNLALQCVLSTSG